MMNGMPTADDADTRARILDAAETAFAERGFAGARVAAISAGAGANKAMVYYYFGNKEKLYGAVLTRVFGTVVDLARQVSTSDAADPPHALVDFAQAYGALVAEHPNTVRIVLRGLLDSPERVFAVLAPKLGEVLPLLASRVAQGQADGSINPALLPPLVPPALVAPMVFIQLAGPLLTRITGMPLPTIHELWGSNLRELSLNGLATARPEESP